MKGIDEERMREILRRCRVAEARYLADELRSEDAGVRRRAVEGLAEPGPEARRWEVVQGLLECLRKKDEDAETREGAARALGRLGARAAAEQLIACLDDPDESLRLAAIESLGWIGSEEALPSLAQLLEDRNPHIRWLAGEAIREIAAVQAGLPARWEQEGVWEEPTIEDAEHPPLVRFPEAVRSGWREEERRHVSACEHCQKLVAAQWRVEHPSIWVLVRYLADPQGFADRQAMELHLERDQCRQCRLLKGSGLLGVLAQLMRAGKSLEGLLSVNAADFRMPPAAALGIPRPLAVRTRGTPFLGTPGGGASQSAATLAEREGPEGQCLRILLNEEGALEAQLEIRGPGREPLPGLVELVGERKQQRWRARLEQVGPDRLGAAVELRRAEAAELGEEVVALAASPRPGWLEALATLRKDPNIEVQEAAERLSKLLGES